MDDKKYKELLVRRFTDRTFTDEELGVFIKLINEGKLDTQFMEVTNKDMVTTIWSIVATLYHNFWRFILPQSNILLNLFAQLA